MRHCDPRVHQWPRQSKPLRVQSPPKDAKPLARLAAAISINSGRLSALLYCLGCAGLLLLPLAGKAIYHDENALLVGHSESVIRYVRFIRQRL